MNNPSLKCSGCKKDILGEYYSVEPAKVERREAISICAKCFDELDLKKA